MSQNQWRMEPLGEQAAEEDDEKEESQREARHTHRLQVKPLPIRRLDVLMRRVAERMNEGEELLPKLEQATEYEKGDVLLVDKFSVAVDRLATELREVSRDARFDGLQDMEQYDETLMAAEDLLVALKRGLKDKDTRLKQNVTSHANISSRLPKIDMPRFNGEKLKWYEFWGRFKSMVDGRSDLNDVDKLTYLIAALEGDAKTVIEGLDITDLNYKIAIDNLVEIYGKSDVIIDAHYEALTKIAPAQDGTKDCRRVLNELERHLKILQTMGENVDNNNQLRHILKNKFPSRIQYHLGMSMKNKDNTIGNIRESLKDIISAEETNCPLETVTSQSQEGNGAFTTEALSTVGAAEKRPSSRNPKWKQNKKPRMEDVRSGSAANNQATKCDQRQQNHSSINKHEAQETTAQLHASDLSSKNPGSQPKSKRLECFFCQGNHYGNQCQTYPTSQARIEKVKSKCLVCFRGNHHTSKCNFFNTSPCRYCKKKGHHKSICHKMYSERLKKENSTTLAIQSSYDTILQTAVTTVMNDTRGQETQARLLFDTGSQKSYITTSLMKKLSLNPIETSCLTIYSFGYSKPKCVESSVVCINIKSQDGSKIGINAYVVPTITGLIPSFEQTKSMIRKVYPHLKMAEDTKEDSYTDVLIGNDNYYSFFSGHRKQVQDNLYLLDSKLGWIPSGRPSQDKGDVLTVLTYVQGGPYDKNGHLYTMPDPPLLDDNIKEIWELEAIGVNDPPKVLEQDEIIKYFNETTRFMENRYEVKWPWIQYPSDLPVNYGVAFGRLQGLIRRTDPSVLEQYDAVLKDQLERGIIEVVKEKGLPKTHAVHYLPHHCVVQNNKTTKLRIVYDASAKSKHHCSLNEYLYKGPSMLEDLVSLLLRFRSYPIGIVADVEKAFLQIGLQQEDRDVTRFLWLKDPKKGLLNDNIVQYRFCRVPFGVISSPFLLAATIRHHLAKKQSDEADLIASSLYVDNLVTGADSKEAGHKLCTTTISLFGELSMRIRDWNSNSQELLKLIPPDLRSEQSITTKVLGLIWNTVKDTLSLAIDPKLLAKAVSSKREILRIIASVFDPCGLVSPLILPARLFLQELWVKQYKWDTPLEQSLILRWKQCALPLRFIPEATVPRYYYDRTKNMKGSMVISEELHCFTDASQEAYSAVVYLRKVTHPLEVNIVMARTRLRPVKLRDSMTIPKMELLGVLIGVRLLDYVRRTLNKTQIPCFLWTDSEIVLNWIKSRKLLEPFVSRRVSEIRSNGFIKHGFVNSMNNPADLATREQTTALPPLWWNGPKFLHTPGSEWPDSHIPVYSYTQTSNSRTVDETFDEMSIADDDERKDPEESPEIHEPSESDNNKAVQCNRHQLETVVTQKELDVDNVETKDSQTRADKSNVDDVTSIEDIKTAQKRGFPKEIAGSPTSLSTSLGLFTDDQGVLRCKGRFQNALIPYDQKYPVLLPKEDPLTLSVIKKVHENNYHVGTAQTLVLLRQKYWVPTGRSQVSKVIKRCPQCIKYGGGPYKLPPMPPLPQERVQFCRPFLYTGLDYLGPLTVVEDQVNKKRWCCIFTCMASRAVRLEVVKNLSAEEFLLCLRRFVAAQGAPALIVSDNAAQFKLAAEVIQAPICTENKVAWHFIPELAPWHGGFYERLVGLVKHCLRRALDKLILSDNQLVTVFKEIETILNSRPLTYVGPDLEHVLTPADFLSNCGTHPLPMLKADSRVPITATKADLIDGWKKGQLALSEFKNIFQTEYLACLRERNQIVHKHPRVQVASTPHVGDVVQILDEKSKTSNRAHWRVGKILALLPSCDGNVRTAKVQLESGLVLTRSISHLYPLELSATLPPTGVATENTALPIQKPESSTTSVDPSNEYVTEETSTQAVETVRTNGDAGPDHGATCAEENPSSTPLAAVDHGDEHQHPTRPRRVAADAARRLIRQWTATLSALASTIADTHTA